MTHVIVCVIDYGIEIEIEIGFQRRWWWWWWWWWWAHQMTHAPSETRWCCRWSPHSLLLRQKRKTWPTLTNIIKIAMPLMPTTKPLFTRFVISQYSVLTTTVTSSSCPSRTLWACPLCFVLGGFIYFIFFGVVEIQLIISSKSVSQWCNLNIHFKLQILLKTLSFHWSYCLMIIYIFLTELNILTSSF